MRRSFAWVAALIILSSCDRAGLRHFLHRLRTTPRVAADATSPMIKDPDRHLQFLERIKQGDIDVVFFGDSITDWWPAQGEASWARLAGFKPANFGVAGDRTEHLLWRLKNGELEGIDPKVVVILIGTNNIGYFESERPEWVAQGIEQTVALVRERLPETKILLLGIFPRGGKESPERKTVRAVNQIISALADGKKTRYLDIGQAFLDSEGNIPVEVMPDQVHLSAKGYEIWFENLEPVLREMTEGQNDPR